MDQQPTNQPAPNQPTPTPNPAAGLAPNVAAALAYVLGFVTGLFFLVTRKDKFVRFHAMQSIILNVVWIVVNYLLDWVLPYRLWRLGSLVSLAFFLLTVFVIFKAYKNETYKLPVIGDYATKWSAGVK